MKFDRLSIQGFLSFGEDDSVIELRNRGVTLIEGDNRDEATARSNGAGKSSIVDALVWVLYGTTLRGYEGDDVINRHMGKECSVKLVMHDGSGLSYLVIRSRKHSEWKTGLRLFVKPTGIAADEDLTGGTIADTQAKLDKMLGMNLTTFVNSVVFGQTAAYRFSALTDKEQKAVLDDALGISQYVNARDLAAEEARELKTQILTGRVAIEASEKRLDAMAAQQAKMEAETRDFADQQAAKVQALRKELHTAREACAAQRDKLEDITGPMATEAEAAEVVTNARADLHTAISQQATAQAACDAQDTAEQEAGRKLSRFLKLGGACTLCDQPVTPAHRAAHVADHRKRHDAACQTSVELADALLLARKRQQEARTFAANADDLLATVKRTTQERIREESALTVLRERRERIKRELEDHKAMTPPLAGHLAALRQEHADLTGEVQRETLYLAEQEAKLSRIEFWMEAFGAKGIRSLLIDTALPLLNKAAQEYAGILTDGNVTIEFRTQSETKAGKVIERFEVAVVNEHGAATYRGHSAGERAKVDLCVGLAMQRLVTSRVAHGVNVAFFDEPFESLDEQAVERVVQLLTELKHESTFVITHSDALRAYFSGSITVTKSGGQSSVA